MPTTRLEERLAEQFRALIRTSRAARQRLAVQAAHVQPGMGAILAAIGSSEQGCHPKELAARCGLDASTISRAVSALVSRGLVERTADPADGRACILTLTGTGRTVLTDLHRRQTDLVAAALRDWTPADVDAFATALTRFVEDVTDYLDRTSPAAGRTSQPETSTLEAAL